MPTRKQKAAAAALATLIAVPAEGLRQYAYLDPVGVPSICFASTRNVRMGDFKTLPQCKALLTKEMAEAVDAVDACVPGLPVNVLAAFADAAYNLGPKIACDIKSSTAARLLRAREFISACRQLPRWNKARVLGVMVELPGLTTRRADEMALCLSPEPQPTES